MSKIVPVPSLVDLPRTAAPWGNPGSCPKCSGTGINQMAWFFNGRKYRCSMCRGFGRSTDGEAGHG